MEYVCAQSCPTLCNPLDCSPPGSSLHGILQARILEWVAISFSRGSSVTRDWTGISCNFCLHRLILLPLSHVYIPSLLSLLLPISYMPSLPPLLFLECSSPNQPKWSALPTKPQILLHPFHLPFIFARLILSHSSAHIWSFWESLSCTPLIWVPVLWAPTAPQHLLYILETALTP